MSVGSCKESFDFISTPRHLGFTVLLSDTDSLFLYGKDDSDDSKMIRHLIAECKEKIGIDVEHSHTFVKAAIIKKKHCFGVTARGENIVVGMECKKNDRPVWINKAFDQFLED